MSPFSGKRRVMEDDLPGQIAELRDEVSALTRKLSRRGAVAYEGSRDAMSDFYDELTQRLRGAVPMLRQRASAVERTARNNPALAAAVGLAVVGLVISLVAAKRHMPDVSPFEE